MSQDAAITARRRQWSPRGFTVAFVFAVALLGFLALFSWFVTLRPLVRVLTAHSWTSTPCTIVSSRVLEHPGDGNSTYSIDIVYSYTVNGRRFEANRYDFIQGSSSAYAWKAAVVQAHPPGSKATCFVDPRDPMRAVFERRIRGAYFWGLIPLGLFAVLLYVFARGLRRSWSGEAEEIGSRAAQVSLPDESTFEPTDDAAATVLKPSHSRLASFFGILVFALIWNGIIGAISYHALGEGGWFLTIFLSVFMVIGVVLALAAAGAFLALFNPLPVLTLSRGRIPLGGTARLSWLFTGRTGSIRYVKISLKGVERAVYRRGTSTQTDEHVFYDDAIVESTDFDPAIEGDAEIAIPTQLMHSFAGKHNSIKWVLAVHAVIPLWPDVRAEFPLKVSPHESTFH